MMVNGIESTSFARHRIVQNKFNRKDDCILHEFYFKKYKLHVEHTVISFVQGRLRQQNCLHSSCFWLTVVFVLHASLVWQLFAAENIKI